MTAKDYSDLNTRNFARLIWLDFDGCLHPDSVYIHPKKGIYLREPGHQLFEWMPIIENLLSDHLDVGIVLSTSWVSRKSFSYAKRRISPALQARVIGATFHNRLSDKELFSQQSRASQILADVYRRGIKEDYWIAIDC